MTDTALVVDDDAGMRDLLEFKLETDALDVVTRSNGRDCLAYLREEALPAVVVLDVMMPHMDGLEVLERIEEEFEDAPPVLLLTATDSTRLPEKTGVVAGYIEKPFTVAVVEERIRGVLEHE